MKKGFTLIELLIVMVIMGILAAVGLGSFQSSQVKARDSKRKAELNQIGKALEVYYNDRGQYPLSNASGEIIGCGAPASPTACSGGSTWQDDNDTIYMVELPQDPKAPGSVYYYSSPDGRSYQLYARLENNRDISVPKNANTPQVFNLSCGDDNCNYGIASTNTTAQEGRTLADD